MDTMYASVILPYLSHALLLVSAVLLFWLYLANRKAVKAAERSYPPGGSFVEVEGTRLHYLEKGKGRPLVFLHGGILSSYDFSAVLTEAASRGYRAIAFDRPGYGYSERPKKRRLTPRDQAHLLKEALAALQAEQPILVGHSWSASLALAYALAYPRELSGLVLLAPGAYGGKAYPAGAADLLLGQLMRLPLLGSLLAHTLLPPLARKLSFAMVQSTFSPDPVPAGYLAAARALWARPGQLKANREDVLAYVQTVPDMERHYASIATPMVIVVGEQDPFRPELQGLRLHRAVKGSQLVRLPQTGHMIPDVNPKAVVDAVELLDL